MDSANTEVKETGGKVFGTVNAIETRRNKGVKKK